MKRKKNESEHVCAFTRDKNVLQQFFPSTKRFKTLRRKWRESLLISEENGRKTCTRKSTSGYLFEKENHLSQHYYIIHPYSKFREYWEIGMLLEMFLGMTIRSYFISQSRDEVLHSYWYQICSLFCDLSELIDVTLLRFFTGFLDTETRNVSLESRRIFYHYIKQFRFYVSIIGSFPFEFLVFISKIDLKEYPSFKFVIFLKFVKFFDVSKYVVHISKIYNWSEITYRVVFFLLYTFLLIQYLSCMMYTILFGDEFGELTNGFIKGNNTFYRQTAMFYLVSTIFCFQSGISNHFSISSLKDMVFINFVFITSYISNTLLLGFLIQISGFSSSSFIEYEEMIQEVHKYLVQENLPKHIHKKVKKYFEFRFGNKYFREEIILNTLSPPFRQEIASFLCKPLLMNYYSIFKIVPADLANSICLKLKLECFLPGDIISRSGKKATKFYFLFRGTVAIYSTEGKELGHLYEGRQFGLSAFNLDDNYYRATTIALEMSECYVLSTKDFLTCTSEYPGIKNKITQIAKEQLRTNLKSINI